MRAAPSGWVVVLVPAVVGARGAEQASAAPGLT